MVAHPRIGAVRPALHHDLALEHAARRISRHALGQLAGCPIRRDVIGHGGHVHVPRAVQQIEPVHPHLGLVAAMPQLRLQPLQPRAGRHDRLAIDAADLDPHPGLGDGHGVLRLFDQDDARDIGAGRDVQLQPVVRQIGRALALMALQQQQLRSGPRRHPRRGGMRRSGRIRDEAQAQRLLAARDKVRHADRPPIGEDDSLAAQVVERSRRAHLRRAGRRRRLAQQPPQVAVAPRLHPPRRKGRSVADVEGRRHAAAGRYLS